MDENQQRKLCARCLASAYVGTPDVDRGRGAAANAGFTNHEVSRARAWSLARLLLLLDA
jgi:hypothetical protein